MKNTIIHVVVLLVIAAMLNSCGDGKSESGAEIDQQTQCLINQILDNGLCTACAANEVTINNRCIACAINEINVNNSCVACADNEITVNNMCVACASDEVVENNMCVNCDSNEIISNNMCVACGANQRVVNNSCQDIPMAPVGNPSTGSPSNPGSPPTAMCPANSFLNGSSCQCTSNYRASGSVCVVYPGDANHSGGVQAPGSCSDCHSITVPTL